MALATLTIDIDARLANLERDLGKVAHLSEKAAGRMDGAFKAVGLSIAGLASGLTVGAFAGFIKNSIDAADQLNDLAQKTGTSVEALAGLKFAADQNGTSLEAVAQASKKLSTVMAENPDVLKKFGITAKDSTGALVQLADIFAAMPDGVEKSALAVKLLGKSGEEMIPFLNQGSEALRSMVEEGKRLNPVTAEMAKQADQFNDSMNRMSREAGRFGINAANTMLPAMNDIIDLAVRAQKEYGTLAGLLVGIGGAALKVAGVEINPEKRRDNRIEDLFAERKRLRADISDPAGRGGLYNQDKFKADAQAELDRVNAELKALVDEKSAQIASAGKTSEVMRLAKERAQKAAEGNGLYDALNPGGKGKTDPFKLENEAWVREKEFQVAQLNELVKAQEQANQEMQRSALEAQAVIFDIDPIAKASARWEELTALVDKGLLTQEQAAQSYNKTFGEIDKTGNDAFKSLENAVRGWGNQFTDEMTRMVRTGKLNFSSLAGSIINDLLRIQIQKNITDKLIGWGTSALDRVFGSSPTPNALGGVYSGAGISAYSGSVVSSPTVFPFARGVGLMGEAGPEAILPLTRVNGKLGVQAQGGGAPNVVLNVVNQSGQNLSARQQGAPQFDGRSWVLGLVLDAADSDPNFRNALGLGRA